MNRQRTKQGATPGRAPRQRGRAGQADRGAQRRAAKQRQRPGRAGRGRTGWAGMRRSRRQRMAIAGVALVAVAALWIFVDWQLAVPLTALLAIALPAVVVLTTGRRY